jgi:hypothetical protein
VSCRNDNQHVVVAERFVSGAQIFAADLAARNRVSDSGLIEVEFVLDSSGKTIRPIRLSDGPARTWRVRLAPLPAATANRRPSHGSKPCSR